MLGRVVGLFGVKVGSVYYVFAPAPRDPGVRRVQIRLPATGASTKLRKQGSEATASSPDWKE